MISKKTTLKKALSKATYRYRGYTTAEVIGYPTDTRFAIFDDLENQRVVHIPVYSVDKIDYALLDNLMAN